MNRLGKVAGRAGFGCMRIDAGDSGVGVIRAALDAGARILDTANVYYAAGGRLGDNERSVATALSSWGGDATEVLVATKGGMTRRGARWLPDARAKSLRNACEGSLEALGVPCLDLYLLHAPDPNVEWARSVRALAELREAGLVTAIGLCNINRDLLDRAFSIAEIDAVQVALNPFDISAVRGGLAMRCRERGITLLAHSPLGGPKRARRLARHAELSTQAARLGSGACELALAWLRDLAAPIIAIPGASKPETARAAVSAQRLELDDHAREALDRSLAAGPLLASAQAERRAPSDADGDVVIIMGSPGAGKSTLASALVTKGYKRLNRDKRGGSLSSLIEPLEELLLSGTRRVVLDNTYPARAGRNEVIEAAWRHNVPARCVHLVTAMKMRKSMWSFACWARAEAPCPPPKRSKRKAERAPPICRRAPYSATDARANRRLPTKASTASKRLRLNAFGRTGARRAHYFSRSTASFAKPRAARRAH